MTTPSENNPTDDDGGAGCIWGCAILIAIPIVIGIIAAIVMSFSGDDDSPEFTPSGGEAIRQCENNVADQLKSPATAEYDLNATQSGGNEFEVTGTVDSENGFGAMLRSNVSCTVRFEGATAYTTVNYVG